MLEYKKFMYLAGAKEEVVNYKTNVPISGYFKTTDKDVISMRNALITRYGLMISRREIKDLPNRLRYSTCTPRVFTETADKLRNDRSLDCIGVSDGYNSFSNEVLFFNELNNFISLNLRIVLNGDPDLSRISDLVCGNLLMAEFKSEAAYDGYRREFQVSGIRLPASIFIPTYKVLENRCEYWIQRIYKNDYEFKRVLAEGLKDTDYSDDIGFIEYSHGNNTLLELLEGKTNISVYIDGENLDTIQTYLLAKILLSNQAISKVTLVLDSPSMINWEYACGGNIGVEVCKRVLRDKNVGDLMIAYRIAEDKFKNGYTDFLLVSADSDFYSIVNENKDRISLILSSGASKSYISVLNKEGVKYAFIEDLVGEIETRNKMMGIGSTLQEISVLEKIVAQE